MNGAILLKIILGIAGVLAGGLAGGMTGGMSLFVWAAGWMYWSDWGAFWGLVCVLVGGGAGAFWGYYCAGAIKEARDWFNFLGFSFICGLAMCIAVPLALRSSNMFLSMWGGDIGGWGGSLYYVFVLNKKKRYVIEDRPKQERTE
ncbi:hypothetical protein R80B4_00482 [Fibrobacteres bacterium R8-0-B4]